MKPLSLRAFALSTLAIVAASGLTNVTNAAPAAAAPEEPFVILAVFPHPSENVGFSDSWRARRPGGRRHTGTDIISPRGTEIVAVADGVITELGQSRMSGFNIHIDHGNGWTTAYLHLNNDTPGTDDGKGGASTAFYPALSEGDTVRAGQVIGYVGDSGNAEHTLPHTHFEIKINGKKRNPYPFLTDVWNREHRSPNSAAGPL